ncbi:hypothetical protein AB0D67_31625 [Streptosporangium sp. NPDC048047]|uniref:hypothetical protein n=1 Tax=Streptosporangium sp. NPDC048047 TaxID=3155748 RepID=UPI00343F88E8
MTKTAVAWSVLVGAGLLEIVWAAGGAERGDLAPDPDPAISGTDRRAGHADIV